MTVRAAARRVIRAPAAVANLLGGRFALNPVAAIFAAGVIGAWFDPSDLSTMFQDAAGTTPVTAMEQPVGLWLDKSQRLALGAELVPVNFNAAAGWTFALVGTTSGAASVAGGALSLPRVDASNLAEGGFSVATVVGKTYQVRWTTGAGGAVQIRAGGSIGNATAGAADLPANASGTFAFVATTAAQVISFFPTTNAATSTVTAVSVKNLAGNHATQTTTTARPVVSARYNLLTNSENLLGSGWTVRTSNAVTVNGRVNTLTNSGNTTAGEGVWYQMTAAGNTAYTLAVKAYQGSLSQMNIVIKDNATDVIKSSQVVNLTGAEQTFRITGTTAGATAGIRAEVTTNGAPGSINITGVDIRLTADAALSIPAYQRVNTSTDYDTAGFPVYLKHDGVDDAFSTASINFTTTQQAAVFAGVTKNSDSATGTVASLYNGGNSGTFGLLAPGGAASQTYAVQMGATGVNTGKASPYTAPASNVLSAAYDLSQAVQANQLSMRVNGVAQAPTFSGVAATPQSGFVNQPLGIGFAIGGTNYFNGRIYGLVVVGAAQSATTIAQVERFLGAKMGIAL